MIFIVYISSFIISCVLFHFFQKSTNGVCRSGARLDGKVALVTGGTSGMGLETAKDFAKRGAKVIIACPYVKEGSYALDAIERETKVKVIFELLDLGSFKSVRKFVDRISQNEEKIDILVNNAGGNFRRMTEDGLPAGLQVNFFGHFLLTLLLLPLIIKGDKSRIVNVCSLLHWTGYLRLKDLNKMPWMFQYMCAKLYFFYFTNELRDKLRIYDVTVSCVDPGAVGTNIWNSMGGKILPCLMKSFFNTFYKTPLEGAQSTIFASVDENGDLNNGGFVRNCEFSSFHRRHLSRDQAKLFWNECLKIVKLDAKEIQFVN